MSLIQLFLRSHLRGLVSPASSSIQPSSFRQSKPSCSPYSSILASLRIREFCALCDGENVRPLALPCRDAGVPLPGRGMPSNSTQSAARIARGLHTIRQHSTQQVPPVAASLDSKEAAKFSALADSWWRHDGPFGPLHRLNPARSKFIRTAVCAAQGIPVTQHEPLLNLKVLDVGCGGGILAESLARLGATVHAIDVTEENVRVAAAHSRLDPEIEQRIRYECVSAEAVQARGETYDIVVASEVIEHVKQPGEFLRILSLMLRDPQAQTPPTPQQQSAGTQSAEAKAGPEPLLILSTLNRTIQSYAVAIVGAEYLTGLVPKETHDWRKFITPEELTLMASAADLEPAMVAGMVLPLNFLGGFMQLSEDTSVNYIAAFQRRKEDLM